MKTLIPHLLSTALLISATALAAPPHGELLGPGTLSTGVQETSAALTPDGNTLYFMRSDFSEEDATILLSHRHDRHWSTPQVAPFSGQWRDSEPALSPDGKRLYFVSNRPLRPGGKPLTMQMFGRTYPGTNLWYVEQGADQRWSAPVHVDGALNDGNMLYNPSVAANGDLYFSAHRDDSGRIYQLYVARRSANGHAAPERIDLGDIAHNRMDPAIDPQQRFLVYAGNEGDSLGGADLYIAFRKPDGHWGKPVHLAAGINSSAVENAPALGRRFGELFVASNRRDPVRFPHPDDARAALDQRLTQPLNGSRNLWRFDITDVLRAHGITP